MTLRKHWMVQLLDRERTYDMTNLLKLPAIRWTS
jgi:hypothetical protein